MFGGSTGIPDLSDSILLSNLLYWMSCVKAEYLIHSSEVEVIVVTCSVHWIIKIDPWILQCHHVVKCIKWWQARTRHKMVTKHAFFQIELETGKLLDCKPKSKLLHVEIKGLKMLKKVAFVSFFKFRNRILRSLMIEWVWLALMCQIKVNQTYCISEVWGILSRYIKDWFWQIEVRFSFFNQFVKNLDV